MFQSRVRSLIVGIALSGALLAPNLHAEMLFRMHGSNTVGAELGPALAKRYLEDMVGAKNVHYVPDGKPQQGKVVGDLPRTQVEIEIQAHGSSTAFRSLKAGKADIGMASRPIKAKEVQGLKPLGDFSSISAEHVLGLDGIAVIVPRSNPIRHFSMAQLAAIFSGSVSQWRQLGVKGGRIRVYARDDNSGTYDTFKHLVLGKKFKLVAGARRYESNADLSDDVARDPDAIGFVGLPYIRNSRAVNISAGGGIARAPSVFNVATEDYALARRLFLYAAPNSGNTYVNEFLKFAASTEGQDIVRQVGFVSQNIHTLEVKIGNDYPREYRKLVKGAHRLSVNFRFHKESLVLDSRAQRDLDRLADYVRSHSEIQQLMLFGFSEDARIPIHNISLSEARADAVAFQLSKRNVVVHKVRGYGAYQSVADNSEKTKNRRVEVWVR